eukprot:253421_1
MVIKFLWNGYAMVMQWLFICVTLVSHGLNDYGLLIHDFTHYGKKYVVNVSGTRGDSAKGGSKEVLVIGYGNLWFFKDLERCYIYEEKCGDKKYCAMCIDYRKKEKRHDKKKSDMKGE